MRNIIDHFKRNKFLLFIFIIFFLIRLPLLDQIYLLHDERDIALSGWSISKTGKDLFGNPLPLVFANISPNNPLFAIYFTAFWFLLVPFKTVFFTRLPTVLITSLLIFIFYEIVYLITKDQRKSLLTTIILCFNPWIFHLTRIALDVPLATVFLTLGIMFYLQKKTLLSFFFFFLTAFTYQGFRLLLPFLLVYLELLFYLGKRNATVFFIKNLGNLLFFLLIIFIALKMEPTISKDRLAEIIFFANDKNTQTVIFKRTTSIAPPYLKQILDNKLTVAIEEVMLNFTKTLDTSYLFKNGDFSPINGNATTGQFLFIFSIFYFLGFLQMGKKGTLNDWYILGFIPVGVVPALLSTHGLSFSTRGVLSALGYSYLIALGIIYFYQLVRTSVLKNFFIFLIFFILGTNFLYFIYGYFFRRPITIGELFNENERQLASFLLKQNDKVIIYHNSPRDILLSYLFFAENQNLTEIQNNLKIKNYTYKNVTVKQCNGKIKYFQLSKAIVHEACLDKKTYDFFNTLQNKKVIERIPYHDFSQKTAYFVLE